jgi:hypothetical protein
LEDISEWERELNGLFRLSHIRLFHAQKASDAGSLPPDSTSSSTLQSITPVDLDEAELEAYAEECTKRAVVADFEDIPPEDLFSWSDLEELDDCSTHDEDIEMMH